LFGGGYRESPLCASRRRKSARRKPSHLRPDRPPGSRFRCAAARSRTFRSTRARRTARGPDIGTTIAFTSGTMLSSSPSTAGANALVDRWAGPYNLRSPPMREVSFSSSLHRGRYKASPARICTERRGKTEPAAPPAGGLERPTHSDACHGPFLSARNALVLQGLQRKGSGRVICIEPACLQKGGGELL
jgi:hypothetical protein